MAFAFYNSVGGGDPRTANISLTGHSLGGGLAGLVGSVYNKNSTLFDGMGFLSAAKGIYNYATTPLMAHLDADRLEFKTTVYGSLTPWSTVNTSRLSLIYMKDEVLDGMISGRGSQGITELQLNLGYDQAGLSGSELHSISSLVMTMYANGLSNQNWKAAAQYFWPVLYDDAFANKIGITEQSVPGENTTDKEYSSVLRQIIAYSAIDEGERPYGDTAIRALYDDANDLGTALKASTSENLVNAADSISQVMVQYASILAIKDREGLTSPFVNGVLKSSADAKKPYR